MAAEMIWVVPARTAATDARVAPDTSSRRTRPARASAGTLATLMSVVNATWHGRFAGRCCAGAPPNKAARSHVLNGAVNGNSTSTVGQHAVTRERIEVTIARGWSKVRATRVTARPV